MCQEENQTGAEQGLDVTSVCPVEWRRESTIKLKIGTNVEGVVDNYFISRMQLT